MSSLTTYKAIDGGDVQEVSPDPVDDGGLALNTNFRAIADSLPRNNYGASTNPTADNDSVDTAGIGVDFSKGSRWYNGTAIFECVDPTPTAAVWVNVNAVAATPTLEAVTTAGATTDQAVTLSGGASLAGSNLNMNGGGGSGGGTLNLDQAVIKTGTGGAVQDDGSGGINLTVSTPTGCATAVVVNVHNDGGPTFTLLDGTTLQLNGGLLTGGSGATLQDDGSGNWLVANNLSLPGAARINFRGEASISSDALSGNSLVLNAPGSIQLDGTCQLNSNLIVFSALSPAQYMQDDGSGGINFITASGCFTTTTNMSYGALNNLGNNINLNDGSGSGGGTLNMDGGNIVGASVIDLGNAGAYLQDDGAGGIRFGGSIINPPLLGESLQIAADGTINCKGQNFNLNDGSGSGGGTLNLDGGLINFNGTDSVIIPYGSGGIQMQGDYHIALTLDDDNSVLSLQGEGGNSFAFQLKACSVPTPIAGGIYFDGSHFYGCLDGTTWTQII